MGPSMTSARVGDLESNSARFGNSGSVVRLEEGETWCGQFRNGSNPWMARYVYGLMFLAANLLAWVARDYGHGALTEINSKPPFHSHPPAMAHTALLCSCRYFEIRMCLLHCRFIHQIPPRVISSIS